MLATVCRRWISIFVSPGFIAAFRAPASIVRVFSMLGSSFGRVIWESFNDTAVCEVELGFLRSQGGVWGEFVGESCDAV